VGTNMIENLPSKREDPEVCMEGGRHRIKRKRFDYSSLPKWQGREQADLWEINWLVKRGLDFKKGTSWKEGNDWPKIRQHRLSHE